MFGRSVGRVPYQGNPARRRRGGLRTALGAFLIGAAILQPGFATVVTADPVSPLSVVKTANPNPVASGDQLTYTIAVTNVGGAKVNNVVLTDQVNGVGTMPIPPGLPQLTITSTMGSCTQGGPNGNVVTCDIGTVGGGKSFTVTISGQVTAANGTVLNNTATVTCTKSAQTFTTSGSVQVPVDAAGGGGDLPDLTINKTGPTNVAPGAAFAYNLTVNNLGTVNTANVRVVDTLPPGVAFVSASTTSLFVCTSDAPANPVTVTCAGGAVNQGQNASITLNVTAPDPAPVPNTITNTAVVDPDDSIAESNELNNTSALVYTTVSGPPPTPLLTIAKTDGNPDIGVDWDTGAGPDPVNPGQQLVYKIQVKNNATTRADDVVVSDGTQGLVASSIVASQVLAGGSVGNNGGCFVNAPLVTCKVRWLDPGGTLTVTITGTVIAPAGTTLFNTATVNGNIKNVGVTATDSEETTVRPAVDLTITKADSPDPVCARSWPVDANVPYAIADQHLADPPDGLSAATGTPTELLAPPVCLGGLLYTFVVGNSGQGIATNVVVRDPLPPGVIFDSWENGAGSLDGGFTCKLETGNVVRCTGGTIGAAEIKQIKLLLVAPPNVGSITNTVTVDPNNAIFEPDETNNTASATTAVSTGIDLVTWKGDSVAADPPGDDTEGAPTLIPGTANALNDGYDPIATRGTQTYTIYVDNVGTQDVTGIRLRDTLPADTIFLSVVPDASHGFTCSHDGAATGGIIECVGGHLLGTESEFYEEAGAPAPPPPGDDFATIKIRVFARSTVGTMHNEVRVDPLNEIVEVNELNNLDIEDTTVTVGDNDKGAYIQLKVDKTQESPAGAVATNGTLVYDLKVSNLGTDPVSNIVLKDTLPAGTRFIEAKDDTPGVHAFFCSHDGSATGGVVTCTGGDLDGSINSGGVGTSERHVTIKVFAPNIPGTINNLGTVDPDNLVAEGNEFDNDDQQSTTVRSCNNAGDCTATNAFYELTIDKTQVSPSNPVARNSIVTYDLAVTNLGSDPIFGVQVNDRLPAGFAFIEAKDSSPLDAEAFTCGGPDPSFIVHCSGGTLDGTGDNLGAGVSQTRHIRIRMFAPDTPGSYQNLAFVDPNNTVPEGNEFNNQDSILTVVANGGQGPYIDLKVDKTQIVPDPAIDSGWVVPGGQLAYKLHVTNDNTTTTAADDQGTAFNVTVRDVLPANTTFFNAYDLVVGPGMFTCEFAAGVLDCTGGTLPPGGSRDIYVLMLAPTNIESFASNPADIFVTVGNQAFIDPLNTIPEGDEVNNADSVDTGIKSKINLEVVSKTGPDQAQQNQEADYIITVKNNKTYGDGAIAFNAHVVDYLPVGLIPLSVTTDTSNMACQTFENPVNYIDCIGDMEPDQTVVITVHVFITAEDGDMDNEACIDPDNLIEETNELDNCKIKTTAIGATPSPSPSPAADLIINKSQSSSTVTRGDDLTYTLTVSNVGTAPASSPVTISDDLPPEVDFVSAVGTNGFTCSEAATVVTCTDNGSGLGASQSAVITIQTKVNNTATNSFTNEGVVDSGAEHETDSVTTSVGGADVALAVADVTDTPDPVLGGAVVTYTIVVPNGGTGPANGLDITQTFADTTGLTFISAIGSQGFTCTWADPTVTCSGNLPAGQSTILTVKFDTSASTPSSVMSTVFVDSNLEFTELDELDNFDFETTTVDTDLCTSCYDLVMGPIFANPEPVANHAPVTWNFDVTNVGDIPTSSDPDPGTDEVVIEINVDAAFNEYTGLSVTVPGFTCVTNDHGGDSGNASPEAVCTKAAGLGAGEGVIVSVTVTANTASDPSSLLFAVAADPGNLVSGEFLETNNTGSHPVQVDTPPPGP